MEIIKKTKGYNRNLIRLLSTNRNNGYNVNRIINEIEKEKQHYRQRGTERGKALRQRRILHGKGLRNHSVPQ